METSQGKEENIILLNKKLDTIGKIKLPKDDPQK